MEITRWGVGRSCEGTRGQMVRVSRDEALRLIESLSRQLRTRNANDDRAEFMPVTAGIAGKTVEEYFSIVVVERQQGSVRGGARSAKGTRKRTKKDV